MVLALHLRCPAGLRQSHERRSSGARIPCPAARDWMPTQSSVIMSVRSRLDFQLRSGQSLIISQYSLENDQPLGVFQPMFKFINRYINAIFCNSIDLSLKPHRLGFGICVAGMMPQLPSTLWLSCYTFMQIALAQAVPVDWLKRSRQGSGHKCSAVQAR